MWKCRIRPFCGAVPFRGPPDHIRRILSVRGKSPSPAPDDGKSFCEPASLRLLRTRMFLGSDRNDGAPASVCLSTVPVPGRSANNSRQAAAMARHLRQAARHAGPLLADGHLIPDQADYLRRCGFSHVRIAADHAAQWCRSLALAPPAMQHVLTNRRERERRGSAGRV